MNIKRRIISSANGVREGNGTCSGKGTNGHGYGGAAGNMENMEARKHETVTGGSYLDLLVTHFHSLKSMYHPAAEESRVRRPSRSSKEPKAKITDLLRSNSSLTR